MRRPRSQSLPTLNRACPAERRDSTAWTALHRNDGGAVDDARPTYVALRKALGMYSAVSLHGTPKPWLTLKKVHLLLWVISVCCQAARSSRRLLVPTTTFAYNPSASLFQGTIHHNIRSSTINPITSSYPMHFSNFSNMLSVIFMLLIVIACATGQKKFFTCRAYGYCTFEDRLTIPINYACMLTIELYRSHDPMG
ncbi:uncharacterized protein PGTG_06806 [Puccinia graminis f. sp. tritici CRL 75-36-700-3]|uniref:Uncharacterized protein n=1 Tax=Puccinia graminis f. sp. tritici (strain CRL 75-36-700-3 / race SCCL) TaxID=418459 RepID=E3KAR6_PUCGT|nr:uncharacterized protein PGTG_06806 [Puccinia graminis f. sp. tritici CRL 75-36-700-3]EFP81185.1 hypothetical protein PGTG_06806 [Puccinia graminis f. sp. tritici CRL 75-36-700-3]